MNKMNSEEILSTLMEKGVLISPELFERQIDEETLREISKKDIYYLDEKFLKDFEDAKNNKKNQEIKKENAETKNTKIKIKQSYQIPPRKRSFQDFVSLFNNRYNNISQMLKSRQELSGITSISRLKTKNQNEKASIIGMVLEKSTTKNNNLVLTVEDPTGKVNVVIINTDKNKELYNSALDISLDEVIGITGTWLNTAIFPERITLPDIPLSKELKKQSEEEYLAIIGDTHFGSKVFMKEEFQKFIEWIQAKSGNQEQIDIAQKVKYVVLPGDIVEGVGIYPSQEEDLEIVDIQDQYQEAANWLKKIPRHIEIIAMSGNHDAGRLSEPQETPFKDMAKPLWDMQNVTMVSNPAYINIGQTKDFQGFDILLYHGGSLIYYSDHIPSIRAAGGQKRCDLIMKYLLQRRHLAPAHGSTLYLPDAEKDYLLIDLVPDFFITGHIHRSSVANYRNVTMINSSCWTETTDDQIKRGLEPLPGRIILVNLKTRQVKVMNFLTEKSKEKEQETLKEVRKISRKKDEDEIERKEEQDFDEEYE